MKEIDLPSGAKLKIQLAPFKEAKNLYQAALSELSFLKLDPKAEVDVNLFKDLFCVGFSSKKIEEALEPCMKRILYNGTKISDDTFESEKAREDYWTICFEVAKANISPFVKSLYAQYGHILADLSKGLA